MERLVSQLIMMARLEETEGLAKSVSLCLSSIIREETDRFLPTLAQKDISVRQEIPVTLQVTGQEEMLRQLVALLLDNAAQYTRDHGALILSAQAERQKVCVYFCNTVEQLPELKPDALMGRFVRGNTARTQKDGGSGIGLSAAKRIAEMHHGSLAVTYPDQHTFCVTVTLPMAAERRDNSQME